MSRVQLAALFARMRATRRGGSGGGASEPPPPPPPPPAFSSEGLWGPEYSYTENQWALTNQAGTLIGGVGSPLPGLGSDPDLLSAMAGSKHTSGFYRPVDGRVYFGWGDWSSYAFSADGTDNQTNDGANPAFVSFDPTDPRVQRRELGSIPIDDEANDDKWYVHADEGPAVYDSDADKILCNGLVANEGADFELRDGNGARIDEDEVPIFVDANTIKFDGDVRTKYAVRRKICVFFTHPTGGVRTPKRGRITAVGLTDASSRTQITIAWIDALPLTLNAPCTAVKLGYSSFVGVPRPLGNQLGGWCLDDEVVPLYDDVAESWYVYLGSWDFTTKLWTAIPFYVPTKDDITYSRFKAGVFVPASKTGGRGKEMICFRPDQFGNPGVFIYNFNAGTLVRDDTAGWGVSINSASLQQPWPCYDGDRYIYSWAWVESRLVRYDVLTKARTTWYLTIDGLPLTSGASPAGTDTYLNTAAQYDAIHCLWNEELEGIELWLNRTAFGAGGGMRIFYINTKKTPPTVEVIATEDADSLDIRTNNPIPVPTIGDIPQRTLCVGDEGDLPTTPKPDKFRTFIMANKREWTKLTNGQRWYNDVAWGASNVAANETSTPYKLAKFAMPSFGGPVEEVDSNGYFTGKWIIFTGGDGDYRANDKCSLRLDQIDAGVLPLRSNITDSSASTAAAAGYNDWHNRIRATVWDSGGTQWQEDMALNPADLSEFQLMAGHTASGDSFVPGYGVIWDFYAPKPVPATPDITYNGLYPWLLRANMLDPPVSQNPKMASYIVGWSDQGANAGKYTRLVDREATAGYYQRDMLAEWNPATGKVLYLSSLGSFYTEIAELTIATGTFTYKGRATIPVSESVRSDVLGLTASVGSRASCCRWLEGNLYLTVQNYGDVGTSNSTNSKVCLLDITGMSGSTTPVEQVVLHNSVLDAWSESWENLGSVSDQQHLAVAFDRPNRMVYWMVTDSMEVVGNVGYLFRVYRSSYDSLEDWKEVKFVDRDTLNLMMNVTGFGVRCWSVYNDHLYVVSTNGAGADMPIYGSAGAVWELPLY
jgi:hypothetical protein